MEANGKARGANPALIAAQLKRYNSPANVGCRIKSNGGKPIWTNTISLVKSSRKGPSTCLFNKIRAETAPLCKMWKIILDKVDMSILHYPHDIYDSTSIPITQCIQRIYLHMDCPGTFTRDTVKTRTTLEDQTGGAHPLSTRIYKANLEKESIHHENLMRFFLTEPLRKGTRGMS